MKRSLAVIGSLLWLAAAAQADKVILKSGKIYEGRIMGETNRSLLISNPPLDPKPRFIPLHEVLTIVRESRPPEPLSGRDHLLTTRLYAGPAFFTSKVFSFDPAGMIGLEGGLRPHPALEVNAGFQIIPDLSSPLVITDRRRVRGYEHFLWYDGGFSIRVFPAAPWKDWRFQPFLLGGYRWDRLIPKGSGDYLKGRSWQVGTGVTWAWRRPWHWDLRFIYQRTNFHQVHFLDGTGDLSDVTAQRYLLQTGLSYHFL